MPNDAREPGMKRVYYHGGKAGLPVGGYILLACETGYTKLNRRLKEFFGGEYDECVYDMNLVYTTSQVEWAIPHAVVCDGLVYEVEPEGGISPEQDDLGLPTGFRSSRARIVSPVQDSILSLGGMCWACCGLGLRWPTVIYGCWTTRTTRRRQSHRPD